MQTKGEFYNLLVKEYEAGNVAQMGYMSSYDYLDDPRRLAISASRYKFVAKMFAGFERVLELGCADAFFSAIVAQSVKHLVASDYDPVFIEHAKRLNRPKNMDLRVLDLAQAASDGEQFCGVYALDVFEHIHPKDEDAFMQNITKVLKNGGGGGTPKMMAVAC